MQTFEILCKRLKNIKIKLDEINIANCGVGIVILNHPKV